MRWQRCGRPGVVASTTAELPTADGKRDCGVAPEEIDPACGLIHNAAR